MNWDLIFTSTWVTNFWSSWDKMMCSLLGANMWYSQCEAGGPGIKRGWLVPVVVAVIAILFWDNIIMMLGEVADALSKHDRKTTLMRNRSGQMWVSDRQIRELKGIGYQKLGPVTGRDRLVKMDDEGRETGWAELEYHDED